MEKIAIPDSQRLRYELMDDSDAHLLWQLDQCEDVMRFINGGKKTSLKDIKEVMLPRMNSYRDPHNGWGLWKVSTIDSSEYLGWILVRPMHFFSTQKDDNNLELGWRFHKSKWGFGYATEAATTIRQALKQQRVIEKFSAIADQNNHASIAIMKKLGMTFDKRDVYKDPLLDAIVDFYST